MVTLDNAIFSAMLEEEKIRLEGVKPQTLYFYKYLKRVLESRWQELNPVFPMEIKIPKANKYLLKQDFEPAQIIRLEEPIRMSDGTPIWFANTMDEAYLRFGYDNLDARFISKQKFNMEFIRATCSATNIKSGITGYSVMN